MQVQRRRSQRGNLDDIQAPPRYLLLQSPRLIMGDLHLRTRLSHEVLPGMEERLCFLRFHHYRLVCDGDRPIHRLIFASTSSRER